MAQLYRSGPPSLLNIWGEIAESRLKIVESRFDSRGNFYTFAGIVVNILCR
jgi:hypothetical protein